MSNTKVVAKSSPNATGAVGITLAIDILRQSAMRKRGIVAEDVQTVSDLIKANTTLSKSAVFGELLTALGGDKNPIISRASLYRYATIAELITMHNMPITVDTVSAVYPATESGFVPTQTAIKAFTPRQRKDVETYVKAVTAAVKKNVKAIADAKTAADKQKALDKAAADKAAAESGESIESGESVDTGESVKTANMTPAAFVKSVSELFANVKTADRVKALDALQDYVNRTHESVKA